ncbi:DUF5422 family protein [Chlamydia sp. 17-3921]|uniref:DUF5422 family protein n=1 Tax=Chlamydia sp. 17-3921 TaxID=2675798 RepID=UPI00191A9B4E|nr:DUF5422 family protein [Chlamydia sp. 17-3921]
MSSCTTCKNGASLYLDHLFPERLIANKSQKCTARYPKIAMIIEVLASVILGSFKILTIPMVAASVVVLIPIQAMIKCIYKRSCKEALPYLAAWGINLLVIALLVVSIFAMISVPPEAVFFVICLGVSLGASATLLQVHKRLFPPEYQRPTTKDLPTT